MTRVTQVWVWLPGGPCLQYHGPDIDSLDWEGTSIWIAVGGKQDIFHGVSYRIERAVGEAPTHTGRQGR